MSDLRIVGIDLSGPSNLEASAAVVLEVGRNGVSLVGEPTKASDDAILELVADQAARGTVVVGVDAPLSYQPGGGMRARDRELQGLVTARGMRAGSIMAPTCNRMAYLTLRGLAVARLLTSPVWPRVELVEVHPGAAFCLHGAPVDSVVGFKKRAGDRQELVRWLTAQGWRDLPPLEPTDHVVAAYGAALAALMWSQRRQAWSALPEPPHHPFVFTC